jgi:dihydroorotate dehydrogenase (NAD+) catalytic subunit
MTDLSIDLGFIKLKNPVIASSGTFGYGLEFALLPAWLKLQAD